MPTKAMSFSQRRPSRRVPDYRESSASRGYNHEWRQARLWHLRQHPLCVFCSSAASVVDHIVPISAGGGRLDPDNLRSVCVDCHAKLTANYKRTGINEMPVKPANFRGNEGFNTEKRASIGVGGQKC